MYQLREASQGEDIYLNVDAFLKGKGEQTKAFHHRYERVGLQESSPQNNFRRIISCRIPAGRFCNHKINYTTSAHSKVPLELVLFVLNSQFADWYFRLGSTNAAVSHYQLTNIPCPRFGEQGGEFDPKAIDAIDTLLKARDFGAIEATCVALTSSDDSRPTLEQIIITLVRFIEAEEMARGAIARSARSQLAGNTQRCQEILDKTMLKLLGVDSDKHAYIATRLTQML